VAGAFVLALALVSPPSLAAQAATAAADESLPLSNYLTRLRSALQQQQATAPTPLHARVTAESRSGVRRLRIRDFQVLSDSDRTLAGYNLGAGSWDTEVGVLGSAVANEFLLQAAAAGIGLDSLDVVFTSHQDDTPLPPGKVAYPRNLAYTAYIVSPASDRELEALRLKVEQTSPVLNFVKEPQDIPHGRVVYTQTPAMPLSGTPPGLRDFLVEKRAALLARAEAAKSRPRATPPLRALVRVAGGSGLREVRTGESRFQFIHDSPRELAGFDLGPTVEEHQLGVMVTCLTHIFEIQAAQREVVLDGLELEVDGTLTPRRAGSDPPRLRDVRYTVHIASPEPAEKIDALRAAVEAVCPIYNLLKDPQTISGRIVRERFSEATADRTTSSR
jgi:uncharacterized OsmC-like protein